MWISYLDHICCSAKDVTMKFLNVIACGHKPICSKLFSKHLYTAIEFDTFSKYNYNTD
jgi:hypothetical protein